MSKPFLLAAVALLAACGVLPEARMAIPESLKALPEESFGKVGWGRTGEFTFGTQRVRYERSADRISWFDNFSYGRAPLRLIVADAQGERRAECAARQSELSVGVVSGTTKPWTLTCQWGDGTRLQVGEQRALQWITQPRKGEYQRGDLVLALRSVHEVEGSEITLPSFVGYEFMHEGRLVGSLDLSRGTPVLRRPDPSTPVGQAVTEAALALALVWDPA